MNLNLILICTAVFLIALPLTGLLRRYALGSLLIDEVGERTSHAQPTPRGGGAAIVIATALGLVAGMWAMDVGLNLVIALLGGGLMVALVGWVDDHRHVEPAVRLAVHLCSALWLVWWIGPFPFCALISGPTRWAPLDWLATVVAIIWMINLYNFMDGIDSIAAGEVIVVMLAGTALTRAGDFGSLALCVPPLVLAAAAFGFLPWNLPPARIFLGDIGSGFLGFMLAAIIVAMSHAGLSLGLAWGILPGLFIADATVTLLRRGFRRERIFQAHRSHVYQRLARKMGSHGPVTIAYLALSLCWLVPLARLALEQRLMPVASVAAAWLPIFGLAWLLGGGKPDAARQVTQ